MLETKELYYQYQQKLIIQMIQLYLVPQKKQNDFFEVKTESLEQVPQKNQNHMTKIQRQKMRQEQEIHLDTLYLKHHSKQVLSKQRKLFYQGIYPEDLDDYTELNKSISNYY
ncbi:unnamed protein product [Paramecium pentaurelia]|uniref:Uncharacterized protein n=1 Tax=Paramecium pentaurelia TaxID=43138 RepID=A0A8S1UJA9_9CILI|nr:unnamed protein product [Paramecium pentaurelia]